MYLKFVKRTVAIGLTGMSLFLADLAFSPAQATQQFSCNGRMNNGWAYSATFLNGRFTQIRWERSGQPPQVSTLTFASTNTQGEPIYRGSFQAATAVTLIDLSKGNVGQGSQISVGVEEWGWSRGTCGTSGGGNTGGSSDWFTKLRQDLMGVSGVRSREWMRQNGFVFTQTMEHTNTRVVERWNRSSDNSIVDVVITNNVVSDVVRIR